MKSPNITASFYYRSVFLLFLLGLIIIRARELLISPRFWAEEGTLYFKGIYESSWLEGLFFIPQHVAEYINFSSNIPLVIAVNLFPLHYAASITTYFSLFIALIPFFIVLYGSSHIWQNTYQRMVVCILLLLAPTATEPEILVNTINLPVYCGLIALCIVLENLSNIATLQKWIYRGLLFFCGLSGVYTAFLFFVFLWKARLEKTWESWWHVGIVLITSIIQTTLFFIIYQEGVVGSKKLVYFDLINAPIYLFNHHIMTPILGLWVRLELNLPNIFKLGLVSAPISLLLSGLVILLLSGVIYYFIKHKPSPYHNLILIGFISVSLLTTVTSMGGTPGARYAVIPGFLFLLLLFTLVSWQRSVRVVTVFLVMLLSTAIVVGSYYFFETRKYWVNIEQLPKWSVEIKHWQINHDHFIVGWPYPWVDDSWKFYLSNRVLLQSLKETIQTLSVLHLSTQANGSASYTLEIDGLPADFYWLFHVKIEQKERKPYQAWIRFLGEKDEQYGEYALHQVMGSQLDKEISLNSVDRRKWPHTNILPHYQRIKKIVFQLQSTTATDITFDEFTITKQKLSVF